MSAKRSKLIVEGVEISITTVDREDYICLTDMVKGQEGEDHIRNWMRNRNTVEFLGAWELMHNPAFKGVEFDTFLHEAGANRFNLTPRKWIEATNAIGVISRAGRNGGTYAHKDIAFEFGSWISPVFKLYIIKEYQRLKEIETNQYGLEWNVNRVLSKVNYQLQTDAIKNYKIPQGHFTFDTERYAYTEEADLLNLVLFGCTAKQWREANPERAVQGENVRDTASIIELTILSNLENFNANLIRKGIDKGRRFAILSEEAQSQRKSLESVDFMKSLKKYTDGVYVDARKEIPEITCSPTKKKWFGK